MVIRSKPLPEAETSVASVIPLEGNLGEAKSTLTASTGADLSSPTVSVEEKSSSDVKQPATAEKKASTDDSDDPFGALDWKDGIATLPGNISGKEHVVLSLKTTSVGLDKRVDVLLKTENKVFTQFRFLNIFQKPQIRRGRHMIVLKSVPHL